MIVPDGLHGRFSIRGGDDVIPLAFQDPSKSGKDRRVIVNQ
jgi:hypothetical protein